MNQAYRPSDQKPCPQLDNGDRMKQPEFHEIYEQMPEGFKAELVRGTVFVSMPLRKPHAKDHVRLSSILDTYEASTPGVEVLSESTTILGSDDEVQPDLLLRILPEYGGKSRDTYDQYIEGPPELICEIAHSSRAIDLNLKRKRYERAGVLEYIVLCLNPREVHWFDFASKAMLQLNSDGVFRSNIFPGLWLCNQGLLERDYHRIMEVLKQGLTTADHSDFCERLARGRKRDLD